MKRFVMTLALTGVLSVSAFAGDMSTADSPAPSPTPHAISTTTPGQIPSAPGDMHGDVQQISNAALSALLRVLGLVV